MTTPPIVICAGQSNMDKMIPVLRSLYTNYEFLNAAVGATSITQWQQGQTVYEDLISMTQQAIADGGDIRAIFFSQGEADTSILERAEAWKTNTQSFYTSFQADTGLTLLPMIYAQLGADYGRPFWETVKRLQAEMQVHRTKHMVTLDDLAYGDTPPHYADYEVPAIRFMAVFKKALGI